MLLLYVLVESDALDRTNTSTMTQSNPQDRIQYAVGSIERLPHCINGEFAGCKRESGLLKRLTQRG